MASAPTPRPPRSRPLHHRESLLRASILESALELGVGSSCTVTKWVFNPVDEAEEENTENETAVSPSLTYASTATSDDSVLSNALSSRLQPGAGILLPGDSPGKPLALSPSYSSQNGLSPTGIPGDRSLRIQFDIGASSEPHAASPSPTPPSPKGGRLRKLRLSGADSDGGYLSDGGKSKKEKEKKKTKKKLKDDGNATEYESEGGGYFSDAARKDRKKRKKDKKAKAKDTESPAATDYETDGGARNKKDRARPRKGSLMSPGTGDDSDGGNLSESSTKRRGFFRLNTRSRKKRESEDSQTPEVPPVPSLPVALPIAERFLRTPTPSYSMDSSRTTTPVPSQVSATDGESMISYTSTNADDRAGSIVGREGLTQAFRDAQSVHRHSIDMLSAFHNLPPLPSSPSPLKASTSSDPSPPLSVPQDARVSPSTTPEASTSALPKAKGRPIISPPNTSMLAPKHVPTPLVLNSAPSIRSQTALQHSSAGDSYVLITPQVTHTHNPNRDTSSPSSSGSRPGSAGNRSPVKVDTDLGAPMVSPSKQSFAVVPPSPTSTQQSLRPHVLAYYGIPPPTPPPQGPLPDVPGAPRSPAGRSLLSPAGPPPTRELPSTPMSTPGRPARSGSDGSVTGLTPSMMVPVIAEPTPPNLRGRVSPFPMSPVRGDSPGLLRKLSGMVSGASSPVGTPRTERMARYDTKPPGSAHEWREVERLDTQWQPRSVSALGSTRPSEESAGGSVRKKVSFEDERRPEFDEEPSSMLDMGDNEDYFEDRTRLPSYYEEDDERSYYEDSRPPTVYTNTEGGDRSSVWSEADSDAQRSFFDEEKSANTRNRFVKQVEAMYGEFKVPPVPALNIVATPKSPI